MEYHIASQYSHFDEEDRVINYEGPSVLSYRHCLLLTLQQKSFPYVRPSVHSLPSHRDNVFSHIDRGTCCNDFLKWSWHLCKMWGFQTHLRSPSTACYLKLDLTRPSKPLLYRVYKGRALSRQERGPWSFQHQALVRTKSITPWIRDTFSFRLPRLWIQALSEWEIALHSKSLFQPGGAASSLLFN